MIRRAFTITALLLSLLINACAFNHYELEEVPKTVAGILDKTQKLVNQQRWEQAEDLLKLGIELHPDDIFLKDKLRLVQSQWLEKKRRLDDWIMLYEVENLLRQRPLIVSMSQSQMHDRILKLRLSKINSTLKKRLSALISCTEYQQSKVMNLARRCITSAQKIENSSRVQVLVKQLQNQQKGINREHQKNKQKKIADTKAASKTSQLMRIKSLLQAQLYYEAMTLLEPLLKSYESDPKIAILLDEAVAGRDLQVLQLISHGDQLYREEKAKQAIVVWQQAAKLNPNDLSIQRRIDRALKVMDNLKGMTTSSKQHN